MALVCQEVVFDVDESAVFVYPVLYGFVSLRLGISGRGVLVPFESMAAVSVLVSPSHWGSVVAEVHHSCVVSRHWLVSKFCSMQGRPSIPLGRIGKQIKQRVMVQEEILRIPVLRANHIGALDWIATEEDWLQVCVSHCKRGQEYLRTKFKPTIS